jgi:hypothetical protein
MGEFLKKGMCALGEAEARIMLPSYRGQRRAAIALAPMKKAAHRGLNRR